MFSLRKMASTVGVLEKFQTISEQYEITPYRSALLSDQQLVVSATETLASGSISKRASLTINTDLNLNQFSGYSFAIKDGFLLDEPSDIVITESAIYSLWLASIPEFSNTEQYILIKTDTEGKLNWATSLGEAHLGESQLLKLTILEDGDCMVLAGVILPVQYYYEYYTYITKISQTLGTVVWSQRRKGDYLSFGFSQLQTVADGVILQKSNEIIKISNSGVFLWSLGIARKLVFGGEEYSYGFFTTGIYESENSIFLSLAVGRYLYAFPYYSAMFRIDAFGSYQSGFLLTNTEGIVLDVSGKDLYLPPVAILQNATYWYAITDSNPASYQLLPFSGITGKLLNTYNLDKYHSALNRPILTQIYGQTTSLVVSDTSGDLHFFNLPLNLTSSFCDMTNGLPSLQSIASQNNPFISLSSDYKFTPWDFSATSLSEDLFQQSQVSFNQNDKCPSLVDSSSSSVPPEQLALLILLPISAFCCCICFCCICYHYFSNLNSKIEPNDYRIKAKNLPPKEVIETNVPRLAERYVNIPDGAILNSDFSSEQE